MASNLENEKLLSEGIVPHFSRFQFFFDPPHLQQQSKADRRFLQRMFREKEHSNVKTLYLIEFYEKLRSDCEEEQLPVRFQEMYDMILKADGSATRAYQLIVNSLTFYYSRRTWATSVQKCVIDFLDDALLKVFHKRNEQVIAEKTLFELELVCLLELFILRYGAETVDDDAVLEDLTYIRQSAGEAHLSAFVNGTIMSHFGCSLEPRLRRIFERLDLKVKSYRVDPFATNNNGVGRKRKHSLIEGRTAHGSEKAGNSSEEPTISHSSTSEEMEMKEDEEESSSNGVEEHEESDDDDDGEKSEEKSSSPPAVSKRGRRLSTATLTRKSLEKAKAIASDDSTESANSIRITRASRAAAVAKSPRGRRSTRSSTALVSTSTSTTSSKPSTSSSSNGYKAKPSNSAMETRAASILSTDVLEQYRARMNAVKSQRKTNRDELFYGRGHVRCGLFERDTSASLPLGRRSQRHQKLPYEHSLIKQQKSRAGRTVKIHSSGDDYVHIAHLMLNVHNPDPLKPFLPSMLNQFRKKQRAIAKNNYERSDGPSPTEDKQFNRIRRLLRPIGKSMRKRMERMRRKATLKQPVCITINGTICRSKNRNLV